MLQKLRRIHPSKRVKIIGAIMLGLILLSSAYFYWAQSNAVNQTDVDQLRVHVQELQQTGKTKQANDELQSFLHHKMTNDLRAQVTFFLGGSHVLLKQYQQAIDAFQKAVQLDPQGLTFAYAHAIAETALKTNNKDLSIEYYQKAIDIAEKSTDQVDDTYVPTYKQMIKMLQEGQTIGPEKQKTFNVPAGINIPKEFLQ